MRTRKGYTLVELLVAVGIIGILSALALAGVQSARESARRATCASHLRQIGLAMHSYLARENVFPAAYALSHQATGRASAFSAFVRLLADLGEQPLYNAANFQVDQATVGIGAANVSAASARLAILLCPSDTLNSRMTTGPVNFRLNLGTGVIAPTDRMSPAETGAFTMLRWVSAAEFRDGLAATALASERLRGDENSGGWDRQRDPWYANLQATHTGEVAAAVALCSSPPSFVPPHNSSGGATWFVSGYDYTFYNHVITPNSVLPDCSSTNAFYGGLGNDDAGIYAARSFHGSSVNLITADGAVHRIGAGVALPIWRALGTRSGGETAEAPF